jgi:NifU-like protein involved in Fe-S cluster formation
MAAPDSTRLYTPEILALAVELANYPLRPELALRGEARSRSCGSMVEAGFETTGDVVGSVGLRVVACAIGQAAAAIFARAAAGTTSDAIAATGQELERWLGSNAPQPDWPGIGMLDPARAFPARHGAILLPWKAALAALNKDAVAG